MAGGCRSCVGLGRVRLPVACGPAPDVIRRPDRRPVPSGGRVTGCHRLVGALIAEDSPGTATGSRPSAAAAAAPTRPAFVPVNAGATVRFRTNERVA